MELPCIFPSIHVFSPVQPLHIASQNPAYRDPFKSKGQVPGVKHFGLPFFVSGKGLSSAMEECLSQLEYIRSTIDSDISVQS